MVDRPAPLPLWWVLGTFHSAVLVVLIVRFAYPGGGLQFPLSSLNTVVGLGLYVLLWGTTLFTARRALAGLDWLSDRPADMASFYRRALRWGAANGLLFFVALLLAQFAVALATRPPATTIQAVLFGTLFFGTFGTLFAAVIGGLVGVTLGALDIAALRIARALTSSRELER